MRNVADHRTNRENADVVNIAEMRISALRDAIRSNQVSFPSQTPCFPNQSRADIQWRLVQLYFVRGWNCLQLARRYNLTRQRIEQLLAQWVETAARLGYLQETSPPDPAAVNEHVLMAARAGASLPVYSAGGYTAQDRRIQLRVV